MKRHGAKVIKLFALVLVLSTVGCNTVGPTAVRGALVDYNKAVSHSSNEQLLLNLVRLRYGDPPFFLQMGSLSTQYNLEVGAQINPLWDRPDARATSIATSTTGVITKTKEKGPGSGDEYGHNASISYYERPTVTYAPLQGEDYVTQVLSPIRGETLVLMISSGWSVERAMNICVQRMNSLMNAPSASGPTPDYTPNFKDFVRATELMRDLQKEAKLVGKVIERGSGQHLMLSFNQSTKEDAKTKEFKTLCGLPAELNDVPFVSHWPTPEKASLAIQTRSLFGVLHYLSNAVEPPQEHIDAGWVVETRDEDGEVFDWDEVTGKLMEIHHSASRPKDAFIAVRHEGYWFYVKKADTNSKFTFAFLSALFHLQTGQPKNFGPTLTLPVGS